MFNNSLDNKPIVVGKDGEYVRDLTSPMFDTKTSEFVATNVYRVPKEFSMRPDLISQAVYGNTMYAEYILKYNGYSNPFSIEEGDLVFIPELNQMKSNTKVEGSLSNEAEKIRNGYKYIDPTKVPKKTSETIDYDNRNLNENTLKEGALPPNIAQEGEQQIVIRNGRVYFGENIGESACLRNGMTQSEFITQVIKSNNNES
jgi:hypothetical protein